MRADVEREVAGATGAVADGLRQRDKSIGALIENLAADVDGSYIVGM